MGLDLIAAVAESSCRPRNEEKRENRGMGRRGGGCGDALGRKKGAREVVLRIMEGKNEGVRRGDGRCSGIYYV